MLHETFSFSSGAALFIRLSFCFIFIDSICLFCQAIFQQHREPSAMFASEAGVVLTCTAKVSYHENKMLPNKQAVEKLVALRNA